MIRRFLSAKHWQLFLVTFGLPFILQIVLMAGMFTTIASGDEPNFRSFLPFMVILPILAVLSAGVYFGWMWSIGVGMNKMLPDHLRMSVKKFKVALIYPIIYMLLFLFFIGFMFRDFAAGPSDFNTAYFGAFGLIFILHFLAMFCIFYCLYFAAKTIKTAEFQKPVTFGDFVGEFFLLWFYPIGVWFLQPKVNELVEEYEENDGAFV